MAPTSAVDRLQRLLAMLPWIVEQDGPTITEISERFAIDPADLTRDLDTLFLVGHHPFTPDELVEVSIDDDRVWVRYADALNRPLRLNEAQLLNLLAAAKTSTSIGVDGADGPLGRGLNKLAASVELGDQAVDVELDASDPEILETVRAALRDEQAVELDYYSANRDRRSVRMVDPWQLRLEGGFWYLAAWCHESDAERIFRVDRIYHASQTDQAVSTSGEIERPVGEFGAEHGRVELRLEPSARWFVDSFPCERVKEVKGGGLEVEVAYSATPWLERRLLQLGTDATIADPEHRQLAQGAAERVLERYR